MADDPYDIASVDYVEQYNFDVPEGMELMVHVRRRGPYGSDIRENEETGLTHVCQTSLSCTRDELDTVDVDSFTEAFAEELPVTDDFYQGMVSSDEGDFSDPDDGSIEDYEKNTWADWCGSAFGLHLAPFRQKRTVRGWRLCSVTDCFWRRS